MLGVIIAFHVLICLLLMVVILLQASKGGGLSGAFGGTGAASMGAVFGGRGAGSFLVKATVVLSTLFFLSNIVQGLIIKVQPSHKSLVRQEMEKEGKISQTAADLLPPIAGETKPNAATPKAKATTQAKTGQPSPAKAGSKTTTPKK